MFCGLRRDHGCIVGIDRDPPVWHLHPSKMEEPERQLLRPCVSLLVLLHTWSCLIVVVLWCSAVCHPHFSSNDIACVVVRSWDRTHSIHGSDSVKSAGSSTFSLCERSWALVIPILTCEQDQRLIGRFATFTRLARVSVWENPRAPSRFICEQRLPGCQIELVVNKKIVDTFGDNACWSHPIRPSRC